jgi:predicted ester cyclase
VTVIDSVRTYFEALDRRDYDAVAGLLSHDLEFVTPVESLDKPTFMEFIKGLLDAFPDWQFNHGQFEVEGDVVSTRLKMSGTHTETLTLPLPGLKPVAPTRKVVVLPEQTFHYTVRNGKITRIEGDPVPHSGIIGTLEQIGVRLPPIWVMKIVAKAAKLLRR